MCILSPVKDTISAETEPEFRPARLTSDRLKAFRLVYESYLNAGLAEPNNYEMRISPYQLLNTSQIFVSRLGSEVISTVTLVSDSEHGLPMESMFADEVNRLRAEGWRIGEVSCLADRRQDPRRFFESFSKLTRIMAQFARFNGIDNLIVSVHPRHARFYSRLGFQAVSDRVAECPHVRNRPAVALSLDFNMMEPDCYARYFADQIPAQELSPYYLSTPERNFFEHVANESCDIRLRIPEYMEAEFAAA